MGVGFMFGFFLGSGFKTIGGYLGFKWEVSIEVEYACQKWDDNVRERLWGGAGRYRKERQQKGEEEEEEEHGGGDGEKEVEDRDRQDEKTFSAWHSLNNADR